MTEYETLEKLNNKLHQLSAMMVMTHEGAGFQDLEPILRAEYMWAITDMVEEAKALSDKAVSANASIDNLKETVKGADKPQQH